MDVKEYLNQAYRLNELIESNLRELERLEAMSTNITCGELKPDRITGGVDRHDKIGDTVSKIVDLRREINAEIDEYVDIKRAVRNTINEVENKRDKLILRYRYIEFMTWEEIAEKIGCSLRQIYRFHDSAIENIVFFNLVTKCH